MKLTPDQTQRIKTAFLSYSKGEAKVSLPMIDQFICGAIPGLTYEQLQEMKKGRGSADGFDRPAFFQLASSREEYVNFICQYFPPAPEEQKAPEVDALALKAAKGF